MATAATQPQRQKAPEPAYDSDLLDQVIANTKGIALGPKGFVARNMSEVLEIAKQYYEAGLYPKDINTISKIAIAIEHGYAIGLSPSQAVQSICVINGRPTVWGDVMKGLVMASDVCERIEEGMAGAGDDLTAVCLCWRKGYPEPIKARFSVRMAKRAGLWGKAGPWQNYPGRMLQMRARSWALRDAFPDVLKGINVREEVEDFVERTEDGGLKVESMTVSKAGGRPSVTMEDLLKTASLEGEAPDLTPEEVAEAAAKEKERQLKKVPVDEKGEYIDPLIAIEEKIESTMDDQQLSDVEFYYTGGPGAESLTEIQKASVKEYAKGVKTRRAALAEGPQTKKGGKQKTMVPTGDGVGQ